LNNVPTFVMVFSFLNAHGSPGNLIASWMEHSPMIGSLCSIGKMKALLQLMRESVPENGGSRILSPRETYRI
jgi:hypothetical protein